MPHEAPPLADLLGGTGSNVCARQPVREWRRAGHDVTVFSQGPRPGALRPRHGDAGEADVGGLLPVFVLDRYEKVCGRAEQLRSRPPGRPAERQGDPRGVPAREQRWSWAGG